MEKESSNLKNCIEKIKRTISMYTEDECKQKMVGMLQVLSIRRSYLNLLFLKYSFDKVKRENAVKIMEENNGYKILENTFTSTNRDFLNTLLELFIFLDQNRPLNINVLNNYNNIDKNLFYQYLSKSGGLFALFEIYEDEETYLDFIIKNVLNQYVIGDELQFLHKLSYDPRFHELKIDIAPHRTKFTSQSTYLKLLKLLQPAEFGKEISKEEKKVILIKEEPKKEIAESLQKLSLKKEAKPLAGAKKEEIKDPHKVTNLQQKYEELLEKYKILEEKYNKLQHKLSTSPAQETAVKKTVKMPLPGGKKKVLSFKKNAEDAKKEEKVKTEVNKAEIKTVNAKMPGALGKKKPLSFKKPAAKSKLETSQLYCGLKWTKVPKTKGSIFAEMKVAETEKEFSLKDFKQFEVSSQPKKATVVTSKKKPETMRITYLDPKKALSLDIALGRVKMTNEELYKKIVERTLENENLVKQLLLYICTEEEFAAIKSASYSSLGRAEQFFYCATSLSELENSLAGIRFLSLYKSKDHKAIIKNVVDTYSSILNSAELKKLFAYLLIIGNQLNRNTFGSKAEAFSFDSLEKFKTKPLRDFLLGKFDMTELKKQLGILKLMEPVDATIHEFMEVKSAYQRNVVDEIEYSAVCKLFENMVNLQKTVTSYFNVDSDDKLVEKLDKFIKYFI